MEAANNNQADATFSGSSQVAAVFTQQFSVTDRSLEREDVRVFILFFCSFLSFLVFSVLVLMNHLAFHRVFSQTTPPKKYAIGFQK